MPTIYDLKPRFQARLRPLADSLAKAGVTANGVTVAALALSLAHGAWLAFAPDSRWPFLLLPVTLFLRMALNAIDGMMAREHGMKSAAGAVLNELGDVISDAALYLPFELVTGVSAPLVASTPSVLSRPNSIPWDDASPTILLGSRTSWLYSSAGYWPVGDHGL